MLPVLVEKTSWMLRASCGAVPFFSGSPVTGPSPSPQSATSAGHWLTGDRVQQCCGSPASSAGHSWALQSPTSLTQVIDFWPAPPTKSVEILRRDWTPAVGPSLMGAVIQWQRPLSPSVLCPLSPIVIESIIFIVHMKTTSPAVKCNSTCLSSGQRGVSENGREGSCSSFLLPPYYW